VNREPEISETDAVVGEVARAVASSMTDLGLPGDALRERAHLDPFFKSEFERRYGIRPRAESLQSSDFPSVGAVDVVVADPRALIELKWSYAIPPKIYEGVWDAIKLVLLGQANGFDALYLTVGAAVEAWAASESADLFNDGEIDTEELWGRRLIPPRAFNYGRTVGEDCVIGAAGKQPRRVPSRIAVRSIARLPVGGDHELRVVGLSAVGAAKPWPQLEYVATAPRRPQLSVSVQLPARVTQSWIEQTAPTLNTTIRDAYLDALKARGWTESELDERVRPHLTD